MAQRLTHGGESIGEISRRLAQVVALGKLGGKPQAGPIRVDGLEGLIDGRLVDVDRLLPDVEFFLADPAAPY